MEEAKRLVGTYDVKDSETIENVKKCGLKESIRFDRYSSMIPEQELPNSSGAVIYNGMTHSAVVIMPEKKIEVARKLTKEFNLSPPEDDFITWEEWANWNK